MDIHKFPSTGQAADEKEKKKHLKPVTSGVVQNEPPGFLERIGGGEPKSIGEYLIRDILLPAGKNLIMDVIGDGLHMLLWGTPAQKGSSIGSKISYNKMYNGSQPATVESTKSNKYQFDSITIASRGEAEEVLMMMHEIIDTYGKVSVADYYELVGVTGQYTDCNYGWENLSGVDVQRTRNGYFLNLPKATPIK